MRTLTIPESMRVTLKFIKENQPVSARELSEFAVEQGNLNPLFDPITDPLKSMNADFQDGGAVIPNSPRQG